MLQKLYNKSAIAYRDKFEYKLGFLILLPLHFYFDISF